MFAFIERSFQDMGRSYTIIVLQCTFIVRWQCCTSEANRDVDCKAHPLVLKISLQLGANTQVSSEIENALQA